MLHAILIHLRLPFSIFLAPVCLFALSQSAHPDHALSVFLILHLLLFPASNAYNSYYDRDEKSIGLIEKPPPVTPFLLYTAIAFDVLAVLLAWWLDLGLVFMGYLLLYGLVSKAYSHPAIRLKKRPVSSWLVVAVFQGAFTYLAVIQCVEAMPVSALFRWEHLLPAMICTLNLLAVYPLTQVYQHEEDALHGDLTYSRLVGIRGTFLSAAFFFMLAFAAFSAYFLTRASPFTLLLLGACMAPSLLFFIHWWRNVYQDERAADYRNTMRMNFLASLGLNAFFLILLFTRFW